MSADSAENSHPRVGGRVRVMRLLLLALLLIAYHPLFLVESVADVIPDVVDAFFSASGVSTQFLYVLVAGLLFLRRDELAAALSCPGRTVSALVFLLPGLALYFWGLYVNALDLLHVSLVLVGFGAARLLAGRALTRLLVVPALILLIGTPLPALVLHQVIFPMQLTDTVHSVWLLNLIGIPASARGDMITMAEGGTRFAETCTALGFSLWLTIFALAYVYMFRITRWHAVLLVCSAPVIAYLVNLLRAFTLVLNPALEVLSVHTLQGVLFFLIGFTLLYGVDNLLMKFCDPGPQAAAPVNPDCRDSTTTRRVRVLLPMLAMLALASFMLPRWTSPAVGSYPRATLPDTVGKWQLNLELPVRFNLLGSVRYSSQVHRSYFAGRDGVSVFIGLDDRLRRDRSLLSDKNAYHEAIGLVQSQSMVDIGQGVGEVWRVISDYGPERLMTYTWYENRGSMAEEVVHALLALDQSPFRRDEQLRVIRVTTNVEFSPDGREQAEQRLRDFIRDLQTVRKQAAQ